MLDALSAASMDHGLLLTCTDHIPSGRSGHGSSSWNVRFVTEPLQPRGLLRPVYELSPRSIPNLRAGSDLPQTYQVSGFESILGYRLALEGPIAWITMTIILVTFPFGPSVTFSFLSAALCSWLSRLYQTMGTVVGFPLFLSGA